MLNTKPLIALLMATLMFAANPAFAQDEEKKVDLDALMRHAGAAISDEDYEDAASQLRKYVEFKKDNGQAWFLLAYSLHMSGKLDEAIPMHKKAAEFDQFKSTALYNLGCAYSLKEDVDTSIKYLHKALDEGFTRLDMFESDSDLANVKKSKKYKQIQERVDNDGERVEKKAQQDKDKKSKSSGLVGKWKVISGTRQGNEVGAERLPPEITVTEKDFTIPAGDDAFVVDDVHVVADDQRRWSCWC